MKMLNIGCGVHFDSRWTNIDFAPVDSSIAQVDVRNGLPFEAKSFDVIYHSHVLEHLTPTEAFEFLKECFRVLKSGGIIRVAVPDLEQIATSYLTQLEARRGNQKIGRQNHHWMIMELLDQCVREQSGGQMLKVWNQPQIENEAFITSRVGKEFVEYRNRSVGEGVSRGTRCSRVKNFIRRCIGRSLTFFFGYEIKCYKLGRFRLGGEVHKWMYDELSLFDLLGDIGFINCRRQSAFTSQIEKFADFNLDADEKGALRKPDSIYVEASKP